MNKLFKLLEKLKVQFSEDTLSKVLNCLIDEVYIYDLLAAQDQVRLHFNGQDERFYQRLAIPLTEDLNTAPGMYFSLWEGLLELLDPDTRQLLFDHALRHAGQSDAGDYIRGIVELDNDHPEIACFHFNRIEHYTARYFIGQCYLILDSHENAIKNLRLFLKELDKTVQQLRHKGIDLDEDFLIVQWHAYEYLGYCYNRIEAYGQAKECYEKVLGFFSLEDHYHIYKGEEGSISQFQILVNNYLLCLEKTYDYAKALEVLDFTIGIYPDNTYYPQRKTLFEKKLQEHGFAEAVIRQVFMPRRPYNIEQFEATRLIAREKSLEDMIVEQIRYGFKVFSRNLEIYQDDRCFGRQYYIRSISGILDLLLIDRSDDTLYLVELKRNDAGVEVVEQIERYMTGISNELNREVKGIICVHKPDPKLCELVKTKNNIELYTYHFDFDKIC